MIATPSDIELGRDNLLELAGPVGPREWLRRLWAFLPQGGTLPADAWRRRHRFLLGVLILHIPAVVIFALARGYGVLHGAADATPLAAGVLVGALPWSSRVRSAAVALGLVSTSAVLVHLSGGLIEFHFHYFVILGLLSLYQDWVPYLCALAFVLVEHGVVGRLNPAGVYNHPSAIHHPWAWAGVHASFVLAASLVNIVVWQMNERQQLAIDENERRARRILDTAGDAFWSVDATGRITDWNAQAERMFGWTRDEVLGRPLIDTIVPPDRREDNVYALERLARGSTDLADLRVEGVAQRRDGSTFPVEVATSMNWSRQGPALNAFVRDTSERKAQEARLAEALARATEASRAKSQFLANISHELRTPMNGLLGMLSLLRDTALDGDQQDLTATMALSADGLLHVINDILDFAQIEAGELDLTQEEFEVRSLLTDALGSLQGPAADKGLALNSLTGLEVPQTIVGDRTRLSQVLHELIDNAVKFTDRGGVVVQARRIEHAGGPSLRFDVVDSGIGLPARGRAQLFDSFTQADGSSTRRFGGPGLGLAIAKELVELMDGEIGCAPEPAGGSRFWFSVPYEASRQPSTVPELAH